MLIVHHINDRLAWIDPSCLKPYVPKQHGFRKKVFKSKPNVCAKCGSTNKLEAHHIIPIRYLKSKSGFSYQDPSGNNSVENGMILCKKCHLSIHSSK